MLKLAELLGFPCPPMPSGAVPWEVRAAIGKATALGYWKDVWNDGLEVGALIGVAVESTALLLLGFAALVLFLLIKALRGPKR